MRVCLQNGKIERFDNNTHDCISNRVVERKTQYPSTILKSFSQLHPIERPQFARQATARPYSSLLECGSPARKSRGYKCCGYKPYHPDFETCCEEMVYLYKVHTGKRHKDHV